jgi:hypothetical protein
VPFFLPRSRTGEGGRGGPGPAAGGGIQGSAAAGDRGKRKRGRGLSTPVLTLVGDGLRRCLRGKGRPAVEVGGGGANGGVAVQLGATRSLRLG